MTDARQILRAPKFDLSVSVFCSFIPVLPLNMFQNFLQETFCMATKTNF